MLIGYARVSKADSSQRDALSEAGISDDGIYEDHASGKRDTCSGLDTCLKALRKGDVLIVWKLDRLGRDLVKDLTDGEISLRVLTGQGAQRSGSGNLNRSDKWIFRSRLA